MPLTPASRSLNNVAAATRNKSVFFSVPLAAPLLAALLLTALLAAPCINAASVSPQALDNPTAKPAATTADKAPLWNYRVTGRSEQNRELFTQGFVFDHDTLWISSGLYQQSHIVALDQNSNVIHQMTLPEDIFGEGMTIANNQLWVLSWREQRVFRYDLATQKPHKPLVYSGEGWGLTFDGKQLIRSDGSSTLQFHRLRDFKPTRTLNVSDGGTPINSLNELEWINGYIYANVWLTNTIVIIDPVSGHLAAKLDLTGLLPLQDVRNDTDVLNGIAWNAAKKELWVTGKHWPARFRIEVIKPAINAS